MTILHMTIPLLPTINLLHTSMTIPLSLLHMKILHIITPLRLSYL